MCGRASGTRGLTLSDPPSGTLPNPGPLALAGRGRPLLSRMVGLGFGLLLPVRVLNSPPIKLVDFFAPPPGVPLSADADDRIGTARAFEDDRLNPSSVFFFWRETGTPFESEVESTAVAGNWTPAADGTAFAIEGSTADAPPRRTGSGWIMCSPTEGNKWPVVGLFGRDGGRGTDRARSRLR